MATVNFINRPKGQTRGGLLYYHFVQAFPKTENISPQTAHEIALRLADFYKGYEVLVCTHTDREHIHSHFIVNSVSLETGMKLHQSAHAIQEIRLASDDLCREYELSICQPKEHRTKPMTAGEYHSAKKGNSWKLQLMNTIDECMQYATSRDMFMELMESEGYKVKWTPSRKNITYETPEGHKCRDNKLHEEKYLKEMMENEFAIRRKIVFGRAKTAKQATATSTDRDTSDTLTGWEKERATLFSAQAEIAEASMDIGNNLSGMDIADIGSDLLLLGESVEQSNQTAPVIDATTQIVVHERKRGRGHKEDDRESQEFKLSM